MFIKYEIDLKWKKVRIYHDWYLKCYILLLVDVFEKFRNKSLKNYVLCPLHYLSAPALSQDVKLNMTEVEPGLILDTDMHLFFEKSMRFGDFYISKTYSQVNNKKCQQESNFIWLS